MDTNMMKTWLTPLASAISLVFMTSSSYAAMQPLDDQSLSQTVGQAAFYTSYVAPAGTGTGVGANPSDYGFFTLGLNGTVQLNANIQHLQLGCGGVNGPGCDIDISNLGLSGPATGADPVTGIPTYSANRASTDATLTNPFLQLAIKDPRSLSTRSVVGINFGAQKALGMLTTGIDNDTENGIKTLSGYLVLDKATGTAKTTATTITQVSTGTAITGRACSATGLICSRFNTSSYNLTLPSTDVNLTTVTPSNPSGQTTINGSRLASAQLSAIGYADPIYMVGSVAAQVNLLGGVALTLTAAPNTSNIRGLVADAQINESLGFIHNLPINNPISLSLQSEKVRYPGAPAANIAQPGWWLAIADPVNIGTISPLKTVDITKPVLDQVLGLVSNVLNTNPVNCGLLLLTCLFGTFPTTNIYLPAGTTVPFPLDNLILAAQVPRANCYGNLKFC